MSECRSRKRRLPGNVPRSNASSSALHRRWDEMPEPHFRPFLRRYVPRRKPKDNRRRENLILRRCRRSFEFWKLTTTTKIHRMQRRWDSQPCCCCCCFWYSKIVSLTWKSVERCSCFWYSCCFCLRYCRRRERNGLPRRYCCDFFWWSCCWSRRGLKGMRMKFLRDKFPKLDWNSSSTLLPKNDWVTKK